MEFNHFNEGDELLGSYSEYSEDIYGYALTVLECFFYCSAI